MKIMIVMGGFFPGKKYGGPPVSVDNFCTLMSNYDCYIVTHDHDLFEDKPYTNIHEGWNDRGNCKVLYLSDEKYNRVVFENVIREINPDVIYLQGLFQQCVVPCLQLAKKYKIKVLLAPRGELCTGALNIKKYKKLPYIKIVRILGLVKDIHFQSTSDEETEAIKKYFHSSTERVHRLDNIPSIPKNEYSRGRKISGEGRFVFLSRIHPKKNLLSAITYFNCVSGNAFFDIYGPIEDEDYWSECQKSIALLPKNVTVKYCGLVSHDEVHEVFSKYDAFVFPTFSENYGHVIAESLMVGTPVIISDQTPWNDVTEANAGWAIPLTEKSNFISAINKIISLNNDDQYKQCRETMSYVYEKVGLNKLYKKYNDALYNIG